MNDFPEPDAGHAGGTSQRIPSAPAAPAPSRRSDIPIPEVELDADLAALVRRTSLLRQGFYSVVLLVALAGQVSGAVETLHIPLAAAIPAVSALELGGIVVLANADVRRRLGERAVASRLLSAAIAAGAVTFNWLAHADHLLGGFFAGMSALGYLVWLMHTENQRRDRLRIKGDLPPTTPAYEVAGHWLRHPWLTMRARAHAKADPRLGLYDSLAYARAQVRRERREAAIARVLHKKIKAAVDPRTADIAIAVYDLDEIAGRLADRADYDGLTGLIAADLAPERMIPQVGRRARTGRVRAHDTDASVRTDNPPAAAAPSTQPSTPRPDDDSPAPGGRTRTRRTPPGPAHGLHLVGGQKPLRPVDIDRARLLRDRWARPELMPRDPRNGRLSGRQVGEEIGWHSDWVRPALRAYLAGADLDDKERHQAAM